MPTNIAWTDETWNPISGCTKVSPGCSNCYIERTPPFRINHRKFVKGHIPLQFHENRLEQPLHWKKPRRIFVNSLSDLFHSDVHDEFIDRVFAVMALAPRHTFQVLTKRPDRMRAYFTTAGYASRIAEAAQRVCGFDGAKYDHARSAHSSPRRLVLPDADVFWMGSCNPPDMPYRERWIIKSLPLKNVQLGVSVENQHFADERIPLLLQTPAAVRFISAEPLLGPISFRWALWDNWKDSIGSKRAIVNQHDGLRMLDWVITGGESGPKRRTSDPDWFRTIRDQCAEAGVPFFHKQNGGRTASAGGCLLDEQEYKQFPAGVR